MKNKIKFIIDLDIDNPNRKRVNLTVNGYLIDYEYCDKEFIDVAKDMLISNNSRYFINLIESETL